MAAAAPAITSVFMREADVLPEPFPLHPLRSLLTGHWPEQCHMAPSGSRVGCSAPLNNQYPVYVGKGTNGYQEGSAPCASLAKPNSAQHLASLFLHLRGTTSPVPHPGGQRSPQGGFPPCPNALGQAGDQPRRQMPRAGRARWAPRVLSTGDGGQEPREQLACVGVNAFHSIGL